MRGKIGVRLLGAQKGEFIIWDEEVKGFHARRRTASGKVTFAFRYTDERGVKRDIKIGVAGPELSAERARDLAIIEAGKTRGGGDPAKERDAARAMPTVAEVWEDYKTNVLAKKRGRTPEEYERNWLVHIKPRVGDKRIDRLTAADVEKMHKEITEQGGAARPENLTEDERKAWRRRGGPVAANRCRDVLSAICARAMSPQRLWISVNPCKGVEENPEIPRDVRFGNEAISLIQKAAAEEAEDVQIAIGLMLETPLRHRNITAAECAEFVDLLGEEPLWRIPGEKLKGGEPYEWHLSVPLARALHAYIERNRAISPRYLFPLVEQRLNGKQPKAGRAAAAVRERKIDPDKPRASFQSAWERVQARALKLAGDRADLLRDLNEGSIHVFKHTYLSEMADLGASAPELQQIGDHADIRTSMKYLSGARRRVRDLARQRAEQLSKPAA